MRLSSIAPLLAMASIACAVPHNQVPNTTPVNTELIGAEIGDGLSLTNGVLSAVIPDIPTKTSDLINDSGYVTESVTNAISARVTAVAESVPTAVSQLANDAGYVTESITNAISERVTAVAGSIPTKVSQLSNDSGYIATNGIRSVFGQSLVGSGDISGVSYIYPEDGTEHRLTIEADPYNDTVQIHMAIGGDDPSDEMYLGTLGTYITTNWANGVAYGYLDNGTEVMLPTKPRIIGNAIYTLAITDDIPTNNAQLINGAGYVTESVTNGVNGRITAVSNAIPTRVSQLANDEGYVPELQESSDGNSSIEYGYSRDDTDIGIALRASDTTLGNVRRDITSSGDYLTTNYAGGVWYTYINNDNIVRYPPKPRSAGEGAVYTIAITDDIPTATSQLINDSGYITSADIPTKTSDLTNDSGYVTEGITNALSARVTAVSNAIPTRVSRLVNDMDYITDAELPTQVSQLSNDVGYVTEAITNGVNARITAVAQSIPTNNAQLVNGAGYITDHAESSDGQAWIDYNVRTSGSDIGIEMQAVGSDYMLGWRSITSSGEYMTTNWANGLWYRYGENGNKVMYPAKPKTTGFAQTYYLALTDDIPTATSQLTNDSGYITSSDIPEVPTKVSQLTNDKYYVTKSVTNTLSVNVRNLETRVTAVSNAIPTAVSQLANDAGYVTESVTNALSARISGVSMAGDWVKFTDSTGYPRFIGAPNYAETGEGISLYAGRGGTPTEYPLYTYTQLSNLIVAIASQIVPTSDYDTLEYISTDGAAWANIGRPIYGGRWEMDLMPTQAATYQCVIGCSDTAFNNRYYPAFLNANGKWACGFGYSYNSQTDYAANTRYSISSFLLTTTPIFKVGNVQATMTRSDGAAPTSIPADIYVGARNVAGNTVDLPFHGRIYAIVCYDNNTPILNLQPARQRSTGKVGLHDLIGGGFYPSITTTSFGAPQ